MLKFLKHIVFFGLVFFIIDKGFYYFIENAAKKEYDKRLELVLKGEMNKEVIILGSSIGANNISAKQLEQETGLITYNLSYRGADINFQAYVFKTLLKYNTSPKKVFLVIDESDTFVDVHNLNFRTDRLQPLKKYNYINETLIERGEKSVLSRFLCLARINLKDFSFKNPEIKPVNIMTTHGSKMLEHKFNKDLEYGLEIDAYHISKENPINIKAFKIIQTLCVNNNIELFYVFPPSYKRFNTTFYNRFKLLLEKESNIIIYNNSNNKYKEKKYFRDQFHLFKDGAKIFTTELSNFINYNANKK